MAENGVNHKPTTTEMPPFTGHLFDKEASIKVNCDKTIQSCNVLVPQKVIQVDNLLTAAHCALWIADARTKGFIPADIRGGVIRKAQVAEWVSLRQAQILFAASGLSESLPCRVGDRRLAGLHEKIRIFKYSEGDFFVPHHDGGCLRRGDGATSVFTVLIFLNVDFEGGKVRIHSAEWPEKYRDFSAKTGSALIYNQAEVVVETLAVASGTMHVMQVHVLFSNTGATDKTPQTPPAPFKFVNLPSGVEIPEAADPRQDQIEYYR